LRNYFNYFTEIEEHFVRKRGKNLLVSPLDWCLIEVWRESGVPLQVVLRGIDRSFDTALRRHKKVPSTLFYCHQAIMEAFEEYRVAMAGRTEEEEDGACGSAPEAPADSGIVTHLELFLAEVERINDPGCARVITRLGQLCAEAKKRPEMDPGELERELTDLQAVLADLFAERLEASRLREIKAEVKEQTKIYKKHLSKEMYERLRQRYLQRKLLAEHGLPELTLLA